MCQFLYFWFFGTAGYTLLSMTVSGSIEVSHWYLNLFLFVFLIYPIICKISINVLDSTNDFQVCWHFCILFWSRFGLDLHCSVESKCCQLSCQTQRQSSEFLNTQFIIFNFTQCFQRRSVQWFLFLDSLLVLYCCICCFDHQLSFNLQAFLQSFSLRFSVIQPSYWSPIFDFWQLLQLALVNFKQCHYEISITCFLQLSLEVQ